MKHKALALGGLAAAALATSAVLTAPAAAATGYNRCTPGHFCVFVDPNGQGAYASFTLGSPDLRVPISGYVFDNKISSVWNRTGQITWWLHPDYNYGGLPTTGIGWDYQGNLSGSSNDSTSSINHS